MAIQSTQFLSNSTPMKRFVFLLVIVGLYSYTLRAQVRFEPGYIIDNNGNRTDCYIKNTEPKQNPSELFYRLSPEQEGQKIDIHSVMEFGIGNDRKYVRYTGQADLSSNNLGELSFIKDPTYETVTLFLRVLTEGALTLYSYRKKEGNIYQYFYKKGEEEPSQLIYRKYYKEDNKVAVNDYYKQQILPFLHCESTGTPTLNPSQLRYTKKVLIQVFEGYNSCSETPYTNYYSEGTKAAFHMALRPGLNISSLAIDNSSGDTRDADFGSQSNFRMGLELEYVIPGNKGKWSVFVEPTYQYFHASEAVSVGDAEISYSSLEFPFGARYYFYLNSTNKLFVNAAVTFDFPLNSSISFALSDDLELANTINFTAGFGYKYKDKLSLETRIYTPRGLLGNYPAWSGDYNNFSLIFGYTLF